MINKIQNSDIDLDLLLSGIITCLLGPSRKTKEDIVFLIRLSHPFWDDLLNRCNGVHKVTAADELISSRITSCITSMYNITEGNTTSGLTVVAETRNAPLPVINMSISSFQKVKIEEKLHVIFITDTLSDTILNHSNVFQDLISQNKDNNAVKIEITSQYPYKDNSFSEHDKWVKDNGMVNMIRKFQFTKSSK